MRPETLFLLGVWAIYVVFEIYQKKFFMKPGEKPSDAPVEIITAVILLFFMQPFVVASGYSITGQLFPEAQDIIADWHFLAIFGLLLVFDDLTQTGGIELFIMSLFYIICIDHTTRLNIYQSG